MSDLINRNAVLEQLRENILTEDEISDKLDVQYNLGLQRAVRIVKRASAVDAVEVVRCKDCVYRDSYSYTISETHRCALLERYIRDDFHCGYYKKRSGD